MGVLSIIVGSMSLLSQIRIIRLLAFSSICHVGFLLLALYYGGYTAYLQYIVLYAIATINIFIVLIIFNTNDYRSLTAVGLQTPTSHQAYNGLALFFAFSLSIYSLAGIPPLAGFFAKLGLLGTILNQPYIGVALVSIFILGSVISGLNYIRLVNYQINPAT